MVIGAIEKGVWHCIGKRDRRPDAPWQTLPDAVMEIGQARRVFDEGAADMAQSCRDGYVYQYVRLRFVRDDRRIPFFDQKLALKKVAENLQRGVPLRGRAQPQTDVR